MAATHTGSCQLCGREQKLPNGKLSLHGYAVLWNQFNGTCPGSRHQPYELSCDLIKTHLGRVQTQLTNLATQINTLMAEATSTTTWHHEYLRSTRKGPVYVWRMTEAVLVNGKLGVIDRKGDFKNAYNNGLCYDYKVETPLALATHLNRAYAKSLETDILRLQNYVVWAERRIAEWAPQDLKAVA